MQIIYLDESGDPGLSNSPTRYYILAGFSVHHADWHSVDQRLREFRKWAEQTYGLNVGQEIHSAEFLGSAKIHCGLRREERLLIVRKLIGLLARSSELSFFGWTLEKTSGDPLECVGSRCLADLVSWLGDAAMGPGNLGMIIHDQMHKRPACWSCDGLAHIIDRPLARASSESVQLQLADLLAYLLKQSKSPNRYLKEQGAHQLIRRLNERSLGWVEL
jgi:hypothetical protein